MEETLIKVENLSKKFCRDLKTGLWYGLKDLTDELRGRKSHELAPLRPKEFWAIKNLNFEVKRGQCLGLIGRNGAGKSTLLKILNGLIKPDYGQVQMSGRVGALIELGAGFKPILTGRENIFVNGALLGFTTAEIKRKIDSIIEFSEIPDFIDTPVQYYSSGMKIRLGFAIAAQMEPDILLVDEVLAVGDMGFILKCFNKMDTLMKNTAIILVSHNMPQVARMSTNLLVMEKGESIYNSDNISDGLRKYYSSFKHPAGVFQSGNKIRLNRVVLSSSGETSKPGELFVMKYGNDLLVTIEITCHELILNPSIWLAFYDKEQRVFAEVRNFALQIRMDHMQGQVQFSAHIPSIQFAQGVYSITVGLFEDGTVGRQVIFRHQSVIHFTVEGDHYGWAPVQLSPTWMVRNSNLEFTA